MVCPLFSPRLTGRAKLEAEGHFTLKAEPGPGMCSVKGCRKKHITEARGGKLHLCCRHYQARWRLLNPKQAAFRNLKDHAAYRKIPFSLTYEFFLELTTAAGYWTQNAATHGDRLSVDRIRSSEGYTESNVQVLTVADNSGKGNRERFLSDAVKGYLARHCGTFAAWHMAGGDRDSLGLEDDSEPF